MPNTNFDEQIDGCPDHDPNEGLRPDPAYTARHTIIPARKYDLGKSRNWHIANLKRKFGEQYADRHIKAMYQWFEFNDIPWPRKEEQASKEETITAVQLSLDTGENSKMIIAKTAEKHGKGQQWQEDVAKGKPKHIREALTDQKKHLTLVAIRTDQTLGKRSRKMKANAANEKTLSSALDSISAMTEVVTELTKQRHEIEQLKAIAVDQELRLRAVEEDTKLIPGSRAEKKVMVTRMCMETQLTDAEIAEKASMNRSTVYRIRNSLQQNATK